MSVTSLGSGSKGNATLIRMGGSLLLIDNGFSCKEIESRMVCRDINPQDVTAILVTHEHGDHFKGVPTFSNKYDTPVWMNHGTSLHQKVETIRNLHIFDTHLDFKIGEIQVCPVAVPHDSREASQFTFKYNQHKIGILTDIGHITPYVAEQYEDCDILLLEFNHDRELLLQSHYPLSLKNRVLGKFGHLCNLQASEFLTQKITNKLSYLIAMHLSEENNQVELVLESIANSQLNSDTRVILAEQSTGFDWLKLT